MVGAALQLRGGPFIGTVQCLSGGSGPALAHLQALARESGPQKGAHSTNPKAAQRGPPKDGVASDFQEQACGRYCAEPCRWPRVGDL